MLYGGRTFAKIYHAGPALPTARSGIAGVLDHDFIIVAAGECRDKKTFPELEAYDLKIGRWVSLAPLPVGGHGLRPCSRRQYALFLPPLVSNGGRREIDRVVNASFAVKFGFVTIPLI